MQKKRLSIEECDSLMATRSADASGAVWIHAYEEPFELTGFPWFARDHLYRRLPVTPAHKITPAVDSLAWCTAGCKVRFRTNSSRILLRVKLQDNEIMDHMPRTGSNGFDLYTGAPGKEVYYYTTRANDAGYDFEIFRNPRRKCETITIHFPLYKGVDSLQIGVDNDAKVLPPEPYKEGYIAVYGTSITQGGCASRPGMASTSILSRMLKRHILNFGFSGSGKGEPEMAKILSELDPVMFWLDFQANAGDAYLENLENFIRILLRAFFVLLAEVRDVVYKRLVSAPLHVIQKR